MAATVLEGTLCSGLGEGMRFTRLDWVEREFSQKLGYVPHPGTLNLSLAGEDWSRVRLQLADAQGIPIVPPPGFCAARCFPVLINDRIKGAVVLPDVADYPADKLEIVAPEAVRQALGLNDGDRVRITLQIA